MRPSEVAPPGVVDLRDAEVPDALERHDLALLAFLDEQDDVSLQLRRRLESLAARYPQAAFLALDVRTSRIVAEALGVKSVPFVCVFRGGTVVDRLIGAPPDAVLEDVLRMRGGA